MTSVMSWEQEMNSLEYNLGLGHTILSISKKYTHKLHVYSTLFSRKLKAHLQTLSVDGLSWRCSNR